MAVQRASFQFMVNFSHKLTPAGLEKSSIKSTYSYKARHAHGGFQRITGGFKYGTPNSFNLLLRRLQYANFAFYKNLAKLWQKIAKNCIL